MSLPSSSSDPHAIAPQLVDAILRKPRLSELDFVALLSEPAAQRLEAMADRARLLTRQHFGNSIILFTPLYISNYCDSTCAYCSFARQHSIARRHLSLDEIRHEAEAIAATGMRHILVLTGESHAKAPVEYIRDAVAVLRDYFSSIAIEVYPMTEEEYGTLIDAGVDSLTIYQETYDPERYHRLHAGGPKDNFAFRLDAAQRACRRGIHAVTIGALLGLCDWRQDALEVYRHARRLLDAYPGTEVSVSLPRMRPLVEQFHVEHPVSDRDFVQMLTALRIALPAVGITVSTRESREFRNNILPLGVTKMSAGVSTSVGSHSGEASTAQFEIADTRDVDEMRRDLLALGFQGVMHDWSGRLIGSGVRS